MSLSKAPVFDINQQSSHVPEGLMTLWKDCAIEMKSILKRFRDIFPALIKGSNVMGAENKISSCVRVYGEQAINPS